MSLWWVWLNCSVELFSCITIDIQEEAAQPPRTKLSRYQLYRTNVATMLLVLLGNCEVDSRFGQQLWEGQDCQSWRYGGMVGLPINWLFPSLCLLYRVDPSNLPHPSMLLLFSTIMERKKHCQRHNGPKGWVLLYTKETSFGPITSSLK